uniref:Tetraspanin 31 n=1 Tax=Cyprinus carpio TaxID=7962 RepID=A0A8C1IEP5_CYPCA
MVCGGFTCSKNALCSLNVVYMVSRSSSLGPLCGVFGLVLQCSPSCLTCGEKMLQHSSEALKILGGVGLFFSFTEILGVWLAMRYRNQKDPRANPSAFL